jgi:putative hemolysin
MDIARQLLLQALLIFLNAFFAMTEIAVVSLSPTKLKKLAEDGDRSAVKLLKLVETLEMNMPMPPKCVSMEHK